MPQIANDLARIFSGRPGLYAATVIRLALGAGLLMMANNSRAPAVLRIFGGIVLLFGILTPAIGLDRHRRMIDWWLSAGRTIQITWGALALALGVFLIGAIV